MGSFLSGLTFFPASLLFSVGTYAQTADNPKATNSRGEAPASGLSGIWLNRAPRGVGWAARGFSRRHYCSSMHFISRTYSATYFNARASIQCVFLDLRTGKK
jgi:hypothetical protein